MPAEFDTHSSSWLLWPERTDIWPFGAKQAQRCFVEIASTIARFEAVTVGVSSRQYQNARNRLPAKVRVVEISFDGCWIRDTGPTCVRNSAGETRGIDWEFNAWGGIEDGLYFPWNLDNAIAQKILEIERIPRFKSQTILEGGAICTDGNRTLLTTAECVLNQNRQGLTSSDFEKEVQQLLGIEKVIWLPQGLADDETGGHVDNICSFLSPFLAALAWTDDSTSPHYERVRHAYDVLRSSKTADGKNLDILKVPLPGPIAITAEESETVDRSSTTVPRNAGDSLPASYINFYFVNGGILVPQFGAPEDARALSLIGNSLPSYEVAPLNTRDLLMGGGNIHCNTLSIY